MKKIFSQPNISRKAGRANPTGFRRVFSFLLMLALTACLTAETVTAFAAENSAVEENAAADITAACTFTVNEQNDRLNRIFDDNQQTAWSPSENGILTISAKEIIRYIYIEYRNIPKEKYIIEPTDGTAFKEEFLAGDTDKECEFIILPGNATSLRLLCGKAGGGITKLRVFSCGKIPSDAPRWEPQAEKAAIMVIVAHPDDDILWFGGTFPTYSGEMGLSTTVVYMTTPNRRRKSEALDALWTAGVRQYPVFGSFFDRKTATADETFRDWGETETQEFIVSQIRRFKPEVLLTHDLGGEYGHGAHKATAAVVTQFFKAASDPSVFPESAQKYGVWTPKKIYLHLYPKNKIKMKWDTPLSVFGGKTGFEVAEEAFACHVSQQAHYKVNHNGTRGCSDFGLLYSSVGEDTGINDFFENITISPLLYRNDSLEISATPIPPTANTSSVNQSAQNPDSPEAASEPTEGLSSQGAEQKNDRNNDVIAIAVAVIAAVVAVVAVTAVGINKQRRS